MTRLPDADWRHRPGLAKLIVALGDGDTSRFVGGAVRDTLLGLPVSDIDMATRLLPTEIISRLETAGIKAVPTGIAHGTITAVSADCIVEVTTLRRDVATDGRRATVAFTDDWREDAARRDFTINALFADPATGTVFDWFDGIDDLASGHVRFIGAPLERIAEDHLRIMRFFRFHARFGCGVPDEAGYDACAARANDLMALSRERIADELLKLLGGVGPVDAVGLMLARDILKPVLPEITDDAALARLVAAETVLGVAGDPVRRLAALIGPGAAVAEAIGKRLRLSRARVRRLVTACTPLPPMSLEARAYRIGPESALDIVLLTNGNPADVALLRSWVRPQMPLSGGDLIARGLAAGPVVAMTLTSIESRWVDMGFPVGAAFEAIVAAAMPGPAMPMQN